VSLFHLRQALGAEAVRLLAPTPRTVRLNLDGAFADVLRATSGYPLSPSDRNKHAARVGEVRGVLGEEGLVAAWEKGRAMSLEQMVEYAQERSDLSATG
jgi:hypothetical protein